MSIQSRRLNNPLLHWVQRHQSMTTLFHSHPHPVHSTQAMQIPQPPASETVIQAKPMHIQAPTQPNLRIAQPSPEAIVVRPVNNPPLPVNSAPKEAKEPISTPPSRDASAQPDPGWKRLQTIFRKHQEQENPTVESIESPEPSPATKPDVQRMAEPPESPTTANSAQQSEKPSVPRPAPTPPILQRKTNAAATQNASIEYATPKPATEGKAPTTQTSPIESPAASSPESPKAAIPQVSSEPNATVIPSAEHPIDIGAPSIEEESEQLNAPLESVWNVQRIEEPEAARQSTPQPTQSHHAAVDSATPKPVLQRSELESDIRSGSSQNESKPTEEATKLQAEFGVDADVEPELRSAPVEILAPSRPRPAPVNPVKPGATIQRQPQNQPPAQEVTEDRLVETAIGPLPADLWQLIGQKPPESKSRQSVTPESAPPPIHRQTESAEPQAETTKYETTSQPVTGIKMVDFPATVQRQPAATDTAPSAEQPGSVSPSSSQQVAESELDVDELARKVYARIRQRLSMELERLRRR